MNISEYTVELRDIHLYAYHGVMPQERKTGAWFTTDIELSVGNHAGADSDEIADAVNYADVYGVIKEEFGRPSNLLENVCKRIIDSLMGKFPTVDAIKITVCKETPPMGGDGLKACVTLKSTR